MIIQRGGLAKIKKPTPEENKGKTGGLHSQVSVTTAKQREEQNFTGMKGIKAMEYRKDRILHNLLYPVHPFHPCEFFAHIPVNSPPPYWTFTVLVTAGAAR